MYKTQQLADRLLILLRNDQANISINKRSRKCLLKGIRIDNKRGGKCLRKCQDASNIARLRWPTDWDHSSPA
jgi:hypothetical protein